MKTNLTHPIWTYLIYFKNKVKIKNKNLEFYLILITEDVSQF